MKISLISSLLLASAAFLALPSKSAVQTISKLPPLVESYPPTATMITGIYECFSNTSVRVDVENRNKVVRLLAAEGLGRKMTPAERQQVDVIFSPLDSLSSLNVTCTGNGIILEVVGRNRKTKRGESLRIHWFENGVQNLAFPEMPQR